MSSVRNWAAGSAIAALTLLTPVIAFLMVITAELLKRPLERTFGHSADHKRRGELGPFAASQRHYFARGGAGDERRGDTRVTDGAE
jgi:hypothetical protein